MTATQEEKERGDTQVALSHEEAEKLRAVLSCNNVAEMDALARLRTGRLIARPSIRPQTAGGDEPLSTFQ